MRKKVWIIYFHFFLIKLISYIIQMCLFHI